MEEIDLVFDGQNAFGYLERQMAFGPRWPGSPGHQEVGDYIVTTLEEHDWAVEEQRFPYQGIEVRNVIGRMNEGKGGIVILGAHYDTRRIADRTPDSNEPVPGAVDGASGVAVLLELARTLNSDKIEREIWLTFFDAEDNGGGAMPDFDWIVGSTYMAQNLDVAPEAMVLVDMVGDADQQFFYEGNSDPALRAQLWRIAAELGFEDYFIPQAKFTVIDDHLPFAQAGIPAVDIIDFDYPYWHMELDTIDKTSPLSLMRVGRTLEYWLEDILGE
jgi:Zn-dependent M28 family amino/carboxypeptidase